MKHISRTLLLFTSIAMHAAFGDISVRSLDETQRIEGVTQLALTLSQELELTSSFTSSNDGVWIATAIPSQEIDRSWHLSESRFDDDGHVTQAVQLARLKKTVEVTIRLPEDHELILMPQLRMNEIRALIAQRDVLASLRRPDRAKRQKQFAVAMELADEVIRVAELPGFLADRTIYQKQGEQSVRVGFFPTETAAQQVVRQTRGAYRSHLVRVGPREIAYAELMRLLPPPAAASPVAEQPLKERAAPGNPVAQKTDIDNKATLLVRAKTITPENIEADPAPAEVQTPSFRASVDRSTLDEARNAFIDKDWGRAIALYFKASKDPALRVEALERLGVAREKNKQLAHAQQVYRTLISEFPDSEAAQRAQQRLNSLVGINEDNVLREPTANREVTWNTVGHLSQFYRRHTIDIDGVDRRVPIDAVFSDASLTTRRHSGNTFHEGRLQLGHIQDINSEDEDTGGVRIQRLYWETSNTKSNLGLKVGRQSRNRAGVLGRFDGITAQFKQNDTLQWNVVGGFLVDNSYDAISESRMFYGVSADLEFLDEHLQISPFLVQQERDGILDRRAIGFSGHYATRQYMIRALLDYDVYHKALNNLFLSGTYNLSDDWRLNGSVDLRRSPYLTTGNALIGQRFDDLSELEQTLIELELADIAEDRTATSRLVRIGFDGKFNDTWTLSADAATSHYSATNASLGVFGLPSRSDHYFTTQLRANDLFGSNSYGAMQMRYQTSADSSTSSVYFNSRFRVRDKWSIMPRVMVAQRTLERTDQEQLQVRPTLRVDYVGSGPFRFEAEVGYDWSTRETFRNDLTVQGLYLRLGYRALFR